MVAIEDKASPHHVLHSLAEDEEELAVPLELVFFSLLLLVLLFVFVVPVLAFILLFDLLLSLVLSLFRFLHLLFLIIERSSSRFCFLLARLTLFV